MPILVYLAGPDVFVPAPHDWAAQRQALCARYGLHGVSPLDDFPDEPADWATLPDWRRIALRNEAQIARCNAVIANITPFRGPSADPGTAFEIGFARALGRPVFAYSNTPVPFTRRSLDFAATHGGAIAGPGGIWRDGDDLLIERFGLTDNLMLDAAIHASNGMLVLPESEIEGGWRDLSVFERCVALAAERLRELPSPPLAEGNNALSSARQHAASDRIPAARRSG
jgi:nucleoside 2-deoxyribosyltransferase